ncbi:ectonucleoside triphosphate diphosphohydrolase 3 [Mustelus asterias]
MGLKRPLVAAIVVLFGSVIIVVTISMLQHLRRIALPSGFKYGIVFDAGASRTTVYVYNWPAEKMNNTGVVNESHVCHVEGPDISSYDSDPAQAAHSLQKCLNETMEKIPEDKHNSTPLYFGATAGMRLLQIENAKVATRILMEIKAYLQSSPFDLKDVKVISGKEEAIYGWITANYLLDNFSQRRTWKQPTRLFTMKTTGTLDLGGASTEIAFVPERYAYVNETITITLYSYNFKVYIQSLACYGRDEAEKMYRARVIWDSKNASSIEDPCIPSNYNLTLQLRKIFDGLCPGVKIPNGYDRDNNITFIGIGKPRLCEDKLFSMFNFTSINSEGNWIQRKHLPEFRGNFVAFSGFYYTMQALNLSNYFSMKTFTLTVQDFCQKNWDQVQQLFPNVKDSFRGSYCFNAIYVYTLLKRGYNFDQVSWNRINFQEETRSSSFGWALGYMLNLTNMIPSQNQVIQTPISEAVFCGLLFVFSILVLFCSMFICMSIIRSL